MMGFPSSIITLQIIIHYYCINNQLKMLQIYIKCKKYIKIEI